jgi:class 3 adenylate cyclase
MTEIVDSTATLGRLGGGEWNRILSEHYEQARRTLDRHRGVEIGTTGDGETLVSATTREVIAADDLVFEDRGAFELKGIDGLRTLDAVTARA